MESVGAWLYELISSLSNITLGFVTEAEEDSASDNEENGFEILEVDEFEHQSKFNEDLVSCVQPTGEEAANAYESCGAQGAEGIGADTTSAAASLKPTLEQLEESGKRIRQLLVLLLNAQKCQHRDSEPNGEVPQCSQPHCGTMKNVLSHMITCQAGKTCEIPHCHSSTQVLAHWITCVSTDCLVCVPVKQAIEKRAVAARQAPPAPTLMDMKRIYDALGFPFVSNNIRQLMNVTPMPGTLLSEIQVGCKSTPNQELVNSAQPPGSLQARTQQSHVDAIEGGHGNHVNRGGIPAAAYQQSPIESRAQLSQQATGTKDWHQHVTPDLRNHLVYKLVQAIFPIPDPAALLDKRMQNLIIYAQKMESDMYEMANNRSEYYHLLALRIYKIQSELDEKRQKRKEQQQQGGSSSVCDNDPALNGPRSTTPTAVRQASTKQIEKKTACERRPFNISYYGNVNGPQCYGKSPSVSASVPVVSERESMAAVPEQEMDVDWHQHATPDLRKHLINKLVQGMLRISGPGKLMEPQMHSLFASMQKVESELYEMAKSQYEYSILLAEKVEKMQEQLKSTQISEQIEDDLVRLIAVE